jgi:hypothetical protein
VDFPIFGRRPRKLRTLLILCQHKKIVLNEKSIDALALLTRVVRPFTGPLTQPYRSESKAMNALGFFKKDPANVFAGGYRSSFFMPWRLAAVAVLLLVLESSRAQWEATGPGPFRYEDLANWKNRVINDQISNSRGSEQTIQFTTDRRMPKGLLIQQSAPSGDRVYPLHFRGRNTDDSTEESRTLTLGGPVVVDFGKTNDETAFFGESIPINFAFDGGPAVFEMATGNSHIQIRGSLLNARGLLVRGGGVEKGGGRVFLSGKQMSVAGRVMVDGASLYLSGPTSLAGIESLWLLGRSTLSLENGEASSASHLPQSAPIFCSGGTEIRLYAGTNNLSETLGKVFLGENCLELWASAKESGSATLALTELVRSSDAILIVGYESPDSASRVKIVNDRIILNALVGGRGTAGSPNASIVPWARAHGGGNLFAAAGFLSYSREEGFRELQKEGDYVDDPNASKATDNVRITAEATTLSEPKTINSLYLDFPPSSDGKNGLDLAGNTLTVTSGATSFTSEGQITNGTLTTGNDLPLIISGPVFLNAQLAGTGGLIYFGGRYPELRLGSTENTLTGDYVVTYGAIRLGDAENIPDSVTVRLHRDTELIVDGSESITGLAGSGRVRLATQGRSILMLGRSEGTANQFVVGSQGELRPGDVSRERPAAGELLVWRRDDPKDHGGLEFEDGTLYIDVAEKSHDALTFDSENKYANVVGGALSVNLLNGYRPKVGTKWEIIRGTAPATGQGFETIEDASGKGYRYSARPVGNNWVLEVVGAP